MREIYFLVCLLLSDSLTQPLPTDKHQVLSDKIPPIMKTVFMKSSLGMLSRCVAASGRLAGSDLKHWPSNASPALNNMIQENAHRNGSYAVFEMDSTSYRYDIEESLLPFLENKGVLSRASLDPSLKVIPFKDIHNATMLYRETLSSYYSQL